MARLRAPLGLRAYMYARKHVSQQASNLEAELQRLAHSWTVGYKAAQNDAREARRGIRKYNRHGGAPRPRPQCCECCGFPMPPTSKTGGLVFDHDHKTGKFRGWLCFNCNTGIGKLGDSVEGLQRALTYLRHAKR